MQTHVGLSKTLDLLGFEDLSESEQFDLIGILAFYGALEGDDAEQPVADVMDASDLEFSEDVAIAIQKISDMQPSTEQVRDLVAVCAARLPTSMTQTLERTVESVRSIGFYGLSAYERFDLIGILAFHAALDVEEPVMETLDATGFQFSEDVSSIVHEISILEYSLNQVQSLVVSCTAQVFA